MVTHSSILALEIPQTEEPDELQCMGSQRVKYDLETKQQQQFLFHHENDGKSRFDTLWIVLSLKFFLFLHGEICDFSLHPSLLSIMD